LIFRREGEEGQIGRCEEWGPVYCLDFSKEVFKSMDFQASDPKYFYKFITPLIGLSLFIIALFVLHKELSEFNFHEIMHEIKLAGNRGVSLAFIITIISYLLLTTYDYLGLLYAGAELSYRRIATSSFISYSLSHSLGFALITGSSARFRMLNRWGVLSAQIAQLVAFVGVMFSLGYILISGTVLAFSPPAFIPSLYARIIGYTFILACIVFLRACYNRSSPIQIRSFILTNPGFKLAFIAILLGAIDWAVAGAVLYVLLPSHSIPFTEVLSVFLFAQALGLVSNIPGGVGVFEGVVMETLKPYLPAHTILGTLLVYRLIYYILPFILGVSAFGFYEWRSNRAEIEKITKTIVRRFSSIVPTMLSMLVFLGGMMLLLSGATPTAPKRLDAILDIISLQLVEASYLIGSVIGVGLVILSRGLWRRIDVAYSTTISLIALGIIVSITKGLDIEEACVLSFILLILIPARKAFYRKASLLSDRLSPQWILLFISVIGLTIWSVFYFYQHTEYSNELWWSFVAEGDASRSLRATFAATIIGLAIIFSKVLSVKKIPSVTPSDEDLLAVKTIINSAEETYCNLALLGDKQFLFNLTKTGFIMYAVEGGTAVSLGDPVAPDSEKQELVWDFFDLCSINGLNCAFYEVSEKYLPCYIDVGLQLMKLGEEAKVNLETFSLEGKNGASLRHTRNKLSKEGYSFKIIPKESVPDILPALKLISDNWLGDKTKEKGFSLGKFNEFYLLHFSYAVIVKDSQIIAFSNIWETRAGGELSVDLMRHTADAPNGVMEYLFVELMLWGKQNNFKQFNLGMAPFSGFENRPFSPLWSKLGKAIYQRGEKFYNFKGIRSYKEKFNPTWTSRYLACPKGFSFPIVLKNITTLISGGVKEVFTK